jgi:hypothetical protein
MFKESIVGCIWIENQKVILFLKFRENDWIFAASALNARRHNGWESIVGCIWKITTLPSLFLKTHVHTPRFFFLFLSFHLFRPSLHVGIPTREREREKETERERDHEMQREKKKRVRSLEGFLAMDGYEVKSLTLFL